MSSKKTTSVRSTPNGVCGAKTRAGGRCQQRPITGKKRCRMHGGTNPGAKLKHGRYSKVFKSKVLQRVEEMHNDPVDLSLRDEIHRYQILQEEIQLLFEEGRIALQAKAEAGGDDVEELIQMLLAKIEGHYFDQIRKATDSLVSAKERMVKLQLATQYLIGMDDLQVLMNQMVDILKTEVPKDRQEAVTQRILSLPAPEAPH